MSAIGTKPTCRVALQCPLSEVKRTLLQTYRECNCLEVILSEHDVCGIGVRRLSMFAVLHADYSTPRSCRLLF